MIKYKLDDLFNYGNHDLIGINNISYNSEIYKFFKFLDYNNILYVIYLDMCGELIINNFNKYYHPPLFTNFIKFIKNGGKIK